MDPYNAQSYYSDTLSGLNIRGDAGNGLYGSLTKGAINNQTQYQSTTPTPPASQTATKSSGNPYGEILNYLQPRTPTPKPLIGATPADRSPVPVPQQPIDQNALRTPHPMPQQPNAQMAMQSTAAPTATAQATYNPADDAARYQRAQWFIENIQNANKNPNDPNNFPGGLIFDQYGNFVTATTAPPATTPPATTPANPNAPHGNPNSPRQPPVTPTNQLPHERFNPYADWQAEQMYQQANVRPIEPEKGTIKTFPNGHIGRWDGIGWLHIDANGQPTSGEGGW